MKCLWCGRWILPWQTRVNHIFGSLHVDCDREKAEHLGRIRDLINESEES